MDSVHAAELELAKESLGRPFPEDITKFKATYPHASQMLLACFWPRQIHTASKKGKVKEIRAELP